MSFFDPERAVAIYFEFREDSMFTNIRVDSIVVSIVCALTAACSSPPKVDSQAPVPEPVTDYRIGPGDNLNIFVWRNPDISITVPVRPDGKISTPLVEDMQAVGKTPTQLSRDLEVALSEYIKTPKVNVIVTGFVGTFGEQIRVVGMATEPRALSYRQNMTLLDVMIEVGGLADGAAGNRAKIIRKSGNREIEIPVRIHDLLNKGKISANMEVRPGDILIIPESFF
jgi:polysaccharide export outer membrane protein